MISIGFQKWNPILFNFHQMGKVSIITDLAYFRFNQYADNKSP
jgi:hypothetical protein